MNKYLKQSIILHVAVFIAMWIDMPDFWHHDMTLGQNPIIVDLSQVRIDELTNLPTKAEFAEEDQKATVTEHKEQYTDASETEPEPVKDEQPEEPIDDSKEDYVAPPEPEKKPEPDKKPEPKPTPKKPPVPTLPDSYRDGLERIFSLSSIDSLCSLRSNSLTVLSRKMQSMRPFSHMTASARFSRILCST